MFSVLVALSAISPSPIPRPLTEADVNPGPIVGVVFTLLVVSLVFLMLSMNRHIKRIKVNRDDETK
jgi:hypothetical protein